MNNILLPTSVVLAQNKFNVLVLKIDFFYYCNIEI